MNDEYVEVYRCPYYDPDKEYQSYPNEVFKFPCLCGETQCEYERYGEPVCRVNVHKDQYYRGYPWWKELTRIKRRTKDMTKDDLKNWHLAIARNGEQYKVQSLPHSINENGRRVLINMRIGDYHSLTWYNSDMSYKGKREYDIMKVYSIDDPYEIWKLMTDGDIVLTDPGIELIWERPNEATELTVAQIEELLGYPVKVVKE